MLEEGEPVFHLEGEPGVPSSSASSTPHEESPGVSLGGLPGSDVKITEDSHPASAVPRLAPVPTSSSELSRLTKLKRRIASIDFSNPFSNPFKRQPQQQQPQQPRKKKVAPRIRGFALSEEEYRLGQQMEFVALGTLAILLVAYAVMLLKSVLLPLFMAFFFYFLLAPLVDLMTHRSQLIRKCGCCTRYYTLTSRCRRATEERLSCGLKPTNPWRRLMRSMIDLFVTARIPLVIAIALAILLFFAILGAIGYIVVDGVAGATDDLEHIGRRIESIMEDIQAKLTEMGVDVSISLDDLPIEDWVMSFLEELLSVLETILLILIFLIYLLLGRSSSPELSSPRAVDPRGSGVPPSGAAVPTGLAAPPPADSGAPPVTIRQATEVMPRQTVREVFGLRYHVSVQIRRYITVKTIVCAVTALLNGTVYTLFEVPLAVILGLLTFILKYIPNVGSWIAIALPVPLMILDEDVTFFRIVLVVGITAIIHTIMGDLVETQFLSHQLNMHPVFTLLALMSWGFLWGIPGMILAVPISAVLKIICESIDHFFPQFIARAIEGDFRGAKRRGSIPANEPSRPPSGHSTVPAWVQSTGSSGTYSELPSTSPGAADPQWFREHGGHPSAPPLPRRDQQLRRTLPPIPSPEAASATADSAMGHRVAPLETEHKLDS